MTGPRAPFKTAEIAALHPGPPVLKLNMGINIDKAELKETIREVLREELLSLAVSLTPYVSKAEMDEMENTFSENDLSEGEFVDGSAWLGN